MITKTIFSLAKNSLHYNSEPQSRLAGYSSEYLAGRRLTSRIFGWNNTFKPGLHIVVRISEHACDDASKRI